MIIGVTGSSGSGKSTVCEILEEKYLMKVLNADKIAKQLSQKGKEYFNNIVELFGKEILLENGELDRQKLANIIYYDEEKREDLNTCTFKHVRLALQKEIQEICKKKKEAIIVIDAPLLFEAQLEDMCDLVIAVIAKDKELQKDRIMQRDRITKKQAEKRLQVQLSDEYYMRKSQAVIVNNGKIDDLEELIEEVLKKILP